ncbi:caspase-8-like [Hydra vulgaris]|uniref:Caspase-8-like n=1 Tax=Hydra vulgaris TaxID=6087 RepID=A0ABM4B9L7_HYDVU
MLQLLILRTLTASLVRYNERNENLITPSNSKPQTTQPKLMKPGEFLASKSNHKQPSEDSLETSIQETRPKGFIYVVKFLCESVANNKQTTSENSDKNFFLDSQLYYALNSNPVGICHIICKSFDESVETIDFYPFTRRAGTQYDVIELEKVFSWLNFKINLHYDKDAQSILDIIKSPPLNEEKIDCFVCCILSHGFQDGVYGADGKELDFSDMQAAICDSSAKWLIGKPKLFFIAASQRERYETSNNLNSLKSLDETFDFADFCFSVAASPVIRLSVLIFIVYFSTRYLH